MDKSLCDIGRIHQEWNKYIEDVKMTTEETKGLIYDINTLRNLNQCQRTKLNMPTQIYIPTNPH